MNEPISRFTGKAQAYASGRPIYPTETLNQILQATNLPKNARVYDVGAGTGLFTQLLLSHFNHVDLVEPNPDMRSVAAKRLPSGHITIHAAQAESFPAEPHSIDLITAAQAFHWFDKDAAKSHWKSLLKSTGTVALVWNERTASTPFAQEVTSLLQALAQRDPAKPPPSEEADDVILSFFSSAKIHTTKHVTPLNEPELINLVLSRSYAPSSDESDYFIVQNQVKTIFNTHQSNNQVLLPYLTKLFIGQI